MGHTLLCHEGIFHVHTYYHDGNDGGPDGDGGDEENGGHLGVCCGNHLREGVEAVVVEAVVGKDSLLRHVAEESGTESPLFHR